MARIMAILMVTVRISSAFAFHNHSRRYRLVRCFAAPFAIHNLKSCCFSVVRCYHCAVYITDVKSSVQQIRNYFEHMSQQK